MNLQIFPFALLLGAFLASGCASSTKHSRTTSSSARAKTVQEVLSDPKFKQVVAALETSEK